MPIQGLTHTSSWARIETELDWTTLINNIRLDDDPTIYCSAGMDVASWSAAWVLIAVDSTLAPTDVRFLTQFSDDGGTTWWDFVEGFWAALYYEDTDTADGIHESFMLPLGGHDLVRICAIATGTDANNFFDITVLARAFAGSFSEAHA